MEIDSKHKPTIYISGLPSLGSEDIELYRYLHKERMNLVEQLIAKGMRVNDIDGSQPWIKTMLDAAEKADAFVLSPMTSLPETHPHYKREMSQRLFEFFSVVTGIHIGTREKYGVDGLAKPCIIIDPNNQWNKATDLLRDLHEKGMFSSQVEDIVQIAPNHTAPGDFNTANGNAVGALDTALRNNRRKTQKEVVMEYPPEHIFSSKRNDMNRHPFGIAIFGSATTKEPSYLAGVHELGKMSAQRGWRMVTGAGKYGCMGAADRGYDEGRGIFNETYPTAQFKPSHIGVSTQNILRLEGPPEKLDQLIITDNIYDRMEVMIKGQKSSIPELRARDAVKVAFVAPGGTGTLHEFATMMQLATNGSMMDGRRIVLLNFPSHLNNKQGFWDPFIKTAKELGFDDYFDVANTPQQAIDIADRMYREWLQDHKEYSYLPHPTFNPVVTENSKVGGLASKISRSSIGAIQL